MSGCVKHSRLLLEWCWPGQALVPLDPPLLTHTKAGKLLPHLVVELTCLLGSAHLELFGSFWLFSSDTRNAAEDYILFLFFFLFAFFLFF